jgi:hypothetical protein
LSNRKILSELISDITLMNTGDIRINASTTVDNIASKVLLRIISIARKKRYGFKMILIIVLKEMG